MSRFRPTLEAMSQSWRLGTRSITALLYRKNLSLDNFILISNKIFIILNFLKKNYSNVYDLLHPEIVAFG
jgi:hypothetical protein